MMQQMYSSYRRNYTVAFSPQEDVIIHVHFK